MSMGIDYYKNYIVGVDFIDKEHYKLFELCDKIYQSLSDETKSLQLFSDFNDLTITHFKHEEEFMDEINYPYANYHKESHNIILSKIKIFLENKNKYDVFKQKYLIKTLEDYLLKHIDHFDVQIGHFVNKK